MSQKPPLLTDEGCAAACMFGIAMVIVCVVLTVLWVNVPIAGLIVTVGYFVGLFELDRRWKRRNDY